ncbi:MAG: ribonuclease HII [Hyphomonas sp. 32-62-5]|nr:MAG: ribonuclease HII [Hyphomonas sp. 32-62-5]
MSSFSLIIGVDEAGRGPWAGPVTAAAVILDPARPVAGLTDSKKLSEKARDRLAPLIRERALAWSVAEASVGEIDTLNIRQATFLAMQRAIAGVFAQTASAGAMILIDGNALPADLPAPARAIIKGDLTEPSISAASILAKTHRDAQMTSLCNTYPGYGFSGHKGYGTAAHAEALARLGPCPAHRQSFAPVKALLRHC